MVAGHLSVVAYIASYFASHTTFRTGTLVQIGLHAFVEYHICGVLCNKNFSEHVPET